MKILLSKLRVWRATLVLLSLGSILFPGAVSVHADDARMVLSWSDFSEGDSLLLFTGWKFHAGDDPAWVDPAYDDTAWPPARSDSIEVRSAEDWPGIGWFRLHLKADSTLKGRRLAMKVDQFGAAEFYLNGVMVHSLGRVGHSHEEEKAALTENYRPSPLTFEGGSEQVLAVRLSNHVRHWEHPAGITAGFRLTLSDWDSSIASHLALVSHALQHQMLLTGLAVAFCLLHLLMYLFYRSYKPNLYFALFTASIALLSYMPAQMGLVVTVKHFRHIMVLTKASIIATSVFGLWLVNWLVYQRTSIQARIVIGVGALLTLGSVLISRNVVYGFAILALVETLRVVIVAMLRRKSGSWIIGAGFVVFMVAVTYQMLMDMNILPNLIEGFWYWYLYGILALLIAISVHLARQVSGINHETSRRSRRVPSARSGAPNSRRSPGNCWKKRSNTRRRNFRRPESSRSHWPIWRRPTTIYVRPRRSWCSRRRWPHWGHWWPGWRTRSTRRSAPYTACTTLSLAPSRNSSRPSRPTSSMTTNCAADFSSRWR
jgi:hypothetical protein